MGLIMEKAFLLTTLVYGVHGVQLWSKVCPDEVRHGMGSRELVGAGQQRSLDFGLWLGWWFRGVGLATGLRRVAQGRARQDGGGGV